MSNEKNTENENEKDSVIFTIQPDTVSDLDESDDQVHLKIANQIVDIIKTTNTQGYSIGLEGQWGSGKSTVLNLINKSLENEESTFLFYIDAWAHEGDFLRRVFLEKLIEAIKNKFPEVKEDEDFNDLSNKISNRLITRTITHTPQINKFGTFLSIFSLLFLPAGFIFIDNSCKDLTLFGSTPNFLFLTGLIICLLPLIILLFAKLIKKDKILWTMETTDDLTNESTKESEKTSVEFEHYFTLLLDFLSKKKYTKFVCEIDNLDRINSEDSLKIWSTLQIFTKSKNVSIDRKRKEKISIWNIVPYDYDALNKIWPSDTENSFLNKSFQIRIDVPQLPFSGWESIAKSILSKTIKNLPEAENNVIISVLKWSRESITDTPSFRDIKIYINQVGLLYERDYPSIGLFSICYFCVLRYLKYQTIEEIKENIIKGEIKKDRTLNFSDDVELVITELAALCFDVSKEKGMQLVLSAPIQDALQNKKIDIIHKLRKDYGNIILSIIEQVLRNDTGKYYSNYLYTLYKTVYSELEQQVTFYLRNNLSQLTKNISEINTKDLCAIISIANNKGNMNELIISAYTADIITKLKSEKPATNIAESIISILNVLEKIDLRLSYNELTIQGFQNLSDQITDLETFKLFGEHIDAIDNIDSDISSNIQPGSAIKDSLVAATKLAVFSGRKDWVKTINAVKKSIEHFRGTANTNLTVNNIKILESIIMCDFDENSKNQFILLLSSWVFWNYLFYLRSPDALKIASLLICLVNDGSYYSNISNNDNSSTGYRQVIELYNKPENADYFYKMICITKKFDCIWELAKNKHSPIAGAVLDMAVEKNNIDFFKIINVYSYYIKLYDLISADNKETFLELLLNNTDFINELNDESSLSLLSNLKACFDLLCTSHYKVFNPIVKKELEKLEQNDWERAFKDNKLLIEILIKSSNGSELKEIRNNFETAFSDYLINTIKQDKGSLFSCEQLKSLYDLLISSFRNIVSYKISKTLLENEFKCNIDIFDFISEKISFSSLFSEREKDFTIFLSNCLSKKDFACLEKIMKTVGNNYTTGKFSSESIELLEQPLMEAFKDTNEHNKEILNNLQEKFFK